MSRATRSAPLIVLSLAALVVPMVDAAAADGTAHVPLVVPMVDVAAAGRPAKPLDPSTGPELTETTRLADRRSVVIGDRAYAMSTADTLYPAAGWHIRGEMGGVWSQPIKLVDGVWFRVADKWLGDADGAQATSTTAGWGYTKTSFAPVDRITVRRTDFVPDGTRATLVGLTLTSPTARTVPLSMDAHSELMSSYPWGGTTPNAGTFNLQDTGAFDKGALLFRDTGTPPVANAAHHDWAALVAGRTRPKAHQLGANHRGPQDPAVVCPGDGPAPTRCDDGAFGKGTGGQLTWEVKLKANKATTLWFAVAGSDKGVKQARRELKSALANPAKALQKKINARLQVNENSKVKLPGDPLLERSIAWSKQNLADSVQEAHDLQLRPVEEGRVYPAPIGTLAKARWLGAGWPDYPWLFGTDGEYTAFASVAMGQFADIKAHLRALRDISEVTNLRAARSAARSSTK